MYNRKFNCFVRPKYDGSHLTFPGLDRKALGIEDLYPSQKDAIWMDILLGGGIVNARGRRRQDAYHVLRNLREKTHRTGEQTDDYGTESQYP